MFFLLLILAWSRWAWPPPPPHRSCAFFGEHFAPNFSWLLIQSPSQHGKTENRKLHSEKPHGQEETENRKKREKGHKGTNKAKGEGQTKTNFSLSFAAALTQSQTATHTRSDTHTPCSSLHLFSHTHSHTRTLSLLFSHSFTDSAGFCCFFFSPRGKQPRPIFSFL